MDADSPAFAQCYRSMIGMGHFEQRGLCQQRLISNGFPEGYPPQDRSTGLEVEEVAGRQVRQAAQLDLNSASFCRHDGCETGFAILYGSGKLPVIDMLFRCARLRLTSRYLESNSVEEDRAQLRSVVYEFARIKLRRLLAYPRLTVLETRRVLLAFETAAVGTETACSQGRRSHTSTVSGPFLHNRTYGA
jgi:hypothetical protein